MSQMIPDIKSYFRQFVPPRDELLLDLEREAKREGIPIVGPVVGELLFILARFSGASMILELGTATGYSAIYLGRACREVEGRLITVEHSEIMASRARANILKAGLDDCVEVRTGNAIDLMATMEKTFDVIFMDIDKEHYSPALPHCARLLKMGGLLIADNVGFEGAADFNRTIFSHRKWRTVHLLSLLPEHSPETDGLALALRLK